MLIRENYRLFNFNYILFPSLLSMLIQNRQVLESEFSTLPSFRSCTFSSLCLRLIFLNTDKKLKSSFSFTLTHQFHLSIIKLCVFNTLTNFFSLPHCLMDHSYFSTCTLHAFYVQMIFSFKISSFLSIFFFAESVSAPCNTILRKKHFINISLKFLIIGTNKIFFFFPIPH